MALYQEIGTGWPENHPKVKLLTREEVRKLVKTNQWKRLGEIFNFVPVYHFEGGNFIDWRCIPLSLTNVIKTKPKKHVPVNVCPHDIEAMNRVQKRKQLRQLMLEGKWDLVLKLYNFKPLFVRMENGKHVIDWAHISWEVAEVLKCGSGVRQTLYTKEGGIYDPAQKLRIKPPAELSAGRSKMIDRKKRVARQTLEERIPIRQRLYEAQAGKCYYCGVFIPKSAEDGILLSRFWSIDHKNPISRGGTNEPSNLVGSCGHCNSNKSCLTDDEFIKTSFLKAKIQALKDAAKL